MFHEHGEVDLVLVDDGGEELLRLEPLCLIVRTLERLGQREPAHQVIGLQRERLPEEPLRFVEAAAKTGQLSLQERDRAALRGQHPCGLQFGGRRLIVA